MSASISTPVCAIVRAAAADLRTIFENFDIYFDVAQGNGVAKRDQMRRLFRCLNSCNPSGCDHVTLRDFVFSNEIGGLLLERDFA